MPSCMRAPPEQVNSTTGRPFSVAYSNRRVSFSPTTEPIDAIMKWLSMTPIAVSTPPILHTPVLTASGMPTFSASTAVFSAYPGKWIGSAGARLAYSSSKLSLSAI